MTTRLSLQGISASGRHGANPGERDEPQPFEVDLEVRVEVSADELAGTADYRTIVRTAREAVERGSFVLLESLAHAVARAVLALDGTVAVTATVHKPSAAASNALRDVAATVTLER